MMAHGFLTGLDFDQMTAEGEKVRNRPILKLRFDTTNVMCGIERNRPAGLSITHKFVVREERILTNKMYKKRQLW